MSLMGEYIGKRMSAKDMESELLRLIGVYNKIRETFLFVYAAAIGKPIPDITLTMDDYYIICDMLKNTKSDNLDFMIETPGGSAVAAEEIVKFTRDTFSKNAFVVSGEAKSAGTIMVLSGDEILMTTGGSLGPIDAQVKIGRSTISAYDYKEWIDQKREEAVRVGKLNPLDATMVAQISPGELKLVHHALKYAEDLVVEWLPKYKFKNWDFTETRNLPVTDDMKNQRAQEIAEELMNHGKWRTHGRSIKRDDLEDIGLKITKVDDKSKLADTIYRIQTIIRLYFSTTNAYKLFATEKEKIFKNATIVGAPPKIPAEGAASVAEADLTCPKCGKKHTIYAKFVHDPKIDRDCQAKGNKPFPHDNKLICDCGFEIDLSGLRNEIEARTGKKVISEGGGEKWKKEKGKQKKKRRH